MSPNQKAQHGDRDARYRHKGVAKDRLAGEARNDLSDHSHGWENHDVDSGMRVKPEQVLKEQRIAA